MPLEINEIEGSIRSGRTPLQRQSPRRDRDNNGFQREIEWQSFFCKSLNSVGASTGLSMQRSLRNSLISG